MGWPGRPRTRFCLYRRQRFETNGWLQTSRHVTSRHVASSHVTSRLVRKHTYTHTQSSYSKAPPAPQRPSARFRSARRPCSMQWHARLPALSPRAWAGLGFCLVSVTCASPRRSRDETSFGVVSQPQPRSLSLWARWAAPVLRACLAAPCDCVREDMLFPGPWWSGKVAGGPRGPGGFLLNRKLEARGEARGEARREGAEARSKGVRLYALDSGIRWPFSAFRDVGHRVCFAIYC